MPENLGFSVLKFACNGNYLLKKLKQGLYCLPFQLYPLDALLQVSRFSLKKKAVLV